MRSARFAASFRARLGLLLGILAVALSLLAMHQLSSNHTAANPTASASVVMDPPVSHHGSHEVGAGGAGHAHLAAASADAHPASGDNVCPSCAEHSVMALTCLAALMLLTVGWVLIRPAAWRGLRVPQLLLWAVTPPATWLPWPRSPMELSISRT